MYPKRSDRHVKRGVKGKAGALLISLLALLTLTVGGTVAYLVASTPEVENTFTPSQVSCEVTENFNGTTKSNVNVTNNSNIDAYIRVKLVTYRVNNEGQHIGGTAAIPSFNPGTGWFEKDGFYYYSKAVAKNESPSIPLIGTPGITLAEYSDVDGGKQVIEVLAEAIQADGKDANGTPAVTDAWNVTVDSNGNLIAN